MQYVVEYSKIPFEEINEIVIPALKKLLNHKNFDVKLVMFILKLDKM